MLKFVTLTFCLFLSIGLISSCSSEKIIEVTKQYNWGKVQDFDHEDLVQMNSYATEDYLFFLGHKSFSSIAPSSVDVSTIGNISHDINMVEQPSNRKLPISDDYFLSYQRASGLLSFIPTLNPVAIGTSLQFSLDSLDDTYLDFDLPHFMLGECMLINNNNQALIPYSSDSDSPLRFILVNVETTVNTLVNLDSTSTQIIRINELGQSRVSALESIGEYFFVTTQSKVYRIDGQGNIQIVLDDVIYKIAENSNTLYGFGVNNLFLSSDKGLSWSQNSTISDELRMLNYCKIEDKLIGFLNDQIWEFSIEDDEILITELDNDGISGISITSINQFDGKVFLSSLGGVFYKTKDQFFEIKDN